MKKKLVKLTVLVIVFIDAVITFSIIMNKTNEDLTTTMAEATLPVMYFQHGETKINELHGYKHEMDITKMRDSITPIGSDRLLSIGIDTYGMAIDDITYEIRGMDGERLVADGEIQDYQIVNDKIQTEVKVQNLLQDEEEYNMVFAITSGKDTIYYYTRIMQTTACYVDECLEFALQFHDYTFRDDASSFIPTYMDAATGDPTTLNYADLTCTLKQITWADFEGQVLSQPVASFKEINDSYNVVTLNYVITSTNESGETEYYNVEEYYRLRETTTRMYVLNFERTVNQIFRGENTFLTDTGNIQLGIRNPDVEYAANEAGDIICFVQEGELWCYNRNINELIGIFSFRSAEGMDVRGNWNQHDISIVRIDEAGSVDFIVYGYMNRGDHEGEVGIGVYHYDGLAHTVEEEVFIPVTQSYEVLKAELGQLMYENDQRILYLMMAGDVYRIDLSTLSVDKIVTGLKDGCYTSSASGRYFAWVEADRQYSSGTIQVLDLKDGSSHEVSEGTGSYLRPLGFIGEDFIYGIANVSDVLVDAAGNTTFPMHTLKILDTSEGKYKVVKSYTPGSGYISGITIEDYTIRVALIRQSDGQYLSSGSDSIMNREADTEENVYVSTTVTEVKETQVQLALKAGSDSEKTRRIAATNILLESPKVAELELNEGEARFYVYVKGDVLLATDSISDAILLANEKLGIVVDSNQQYVWMRARKNSQTAFKNIAPSEADMSAGSIVQCISAMLARENMGISVKDLVENGQTPKEVLESTLKDSVVLDLTGCTVEEIIFYVSQGNPVFAMTGSDSAVLVVGYTSNSISYYDPQTREISTINREEADDWFAGAGNIFFSFLN